MADLLYLYQSVDLLLVIFVRILGALLFLPLIEETKLPKMALAGLCLGIAIPVYFQMDINHTYYEPNLVSYTFLLIKEIMVGLIIGFVVKLFFQIYALVGTLLSTQGGLGMSLIMDPTVGNQSTLIGRIYMLGLGAFFVISGGYHWLIYTLVESFDIVPIGQALIENSVPMMIVQMLSQYFEIGLKLAMPIISLIIVVDFTMGILARTVPQMNMFVIGIPLKMLIMFTIMLLTIQVVYQYNYLIIEALIDAVTSIIQGMRPL